MSVKTVNDVITRVLKEPAPKVVAIKGAWGCGKTRAWQNLIADLRGECHRQEYSYASLFGMTSINQLRTALVANIQSISMNARSADEYVDPLAIRIRDIRRSSRRFHDKIKAAIEHLPFGKIATIAIDTVLPFLIKDQVICLDDFERMGKSIAPDELLGFISELKEQYNCQVVLVFNEEKLTDDQKKLYQDYREKVIDVELSYAPTVDEALQIALPDDLPCRGQLATHCAKLQIRNIRILFKLAELMRLIYPVIAHFCQEVRDQLAQTLTLLVWLEYGDIGTRDRPDLEFYAHWNSAPWFLHRHQDNRGLTESQLHWDKVISSYGLTYLDDFDRSIYQVIRNGYLEESQIEQRAQHLNQVLVQSGARDTYLQAWDMVHESFDDNEAAAIQRLLDTHRERIDLLGAGELDWTLAFLRRFGRNEAADALLEAFIGAHQNETERFNLEAYRSFTALTDPRLRERFQAVYDAAMARNQPTLEQALRLMLEQDGYSGRNTQRVREASQAEFYALFKASRGPDLKKIIRLCLEYSASPASQAPSPAEQALQQLAEESHLNAYRVESFLKLKV